jgi:hypothetical protein
MGSPGRERSAALLAPLNTSGSVLNTGTAATMSGAQAAVGVAIAHPMVLQAVSVETV